MSVFGWIDFSPSDRALVKEAIAGMKEEGTLDELGIGQIRDAFADLLFPGFSTIQTRAKYFITIPRILRDYINTPPKERGKFSSYLEQIENRLAKKLVETHDETEAGIIGKTRIYTGGVSRRPSVIYWNGLKIFDLIETTLSLADFGKLLQQTVPTLESRHEEDLEGTDLSLKSKIKLPNVQDDWFAHLTVQLSKKEAYFLQDKLSATPALLHSIPAQLIKTQSLETILSKKSFNELCNYVLSYEQIALKTQNTLQAAQEFAKVIRGAHIRYNIILARRNSYEDSIHKYEEKYSKWYDQHRQLLSTDHADFWFSVLEKKLPLRTINFVKQFMHKALSQNLNDIDHFIMQRASYTKRNRSLLYKKVNDKWAGIRHLDYRWSTVIGILQDIQDGLHAEQ